ncbi:ATP-binding protein [Bdellovibrio sp. SKB1291214]|uniref:ATP-binding protein n=1 Tax=Bdellovibrio sp. SKB1291214 TaxID=1732569 RepID=UPI000B518064|nr:ATP-binding protein [Bdellovibrio sp. SKB1291214]UYL10050.1 ATP-binding protein [Bdellovibrio sp. SKB1291214]
MGTAATDQLNNPNKIDPILWVGNVSPIRLPQYFPFQKREVEIILRASFPEARSLLQNQKFSSILVQDDGSPDALDLLVQARHLQPMAPRFYISNELNEEKVREGINKAQVYRFIRWPIAERDIWQQLEDALAKHSTYLSRSLLLKESSSQNKELEALTHSLEGLVDERTQYIEMSHKEESDKLNRERNLVRLIKDLANQNSFEDVLGIIRKELRKFHKIGDPILVYRTDSAKTHFISFQLGMMNQSESSTHFEFPKNAQVPSADLIRQLANHFGRPFAKTYVMPLELRLTNHLLGGNGEAILCIENSLNDKEMPPFVEFMSDRMRPLSMTLDRVLLESQLSAFSYRWEKTFDGMRDPIAIIDVDQEVIRANKKFVARFPDRKQAIEDSPANKALADGQPHVEQIQVDGRLYQVHSYPVVLDNGQATNVVNQYVDITQSRELYLRMLQNEKMGAIGMLAGNIAHELNNPLTGLRSLTQVLLQEADKKTDLYSDLIEIEKAAARSQRIIKNLLDFSKGEDQPAEDISVDEIVERTLPMLKSALRIHRLEVSLESVDKTVHVEPHLVQQVVFNLVNNACQAMKDPGRLRIASHHSGNQVILEIEDSGPGVPEEIQKRIFEPFFTTKKEGQGTGLGLSMSKSVIEKFGGSITLHSVQPHGARFVIALPCK